MTEAQNGQNGQNGINAKPDPTSLTTDQLEREITHLRELIEARLTQMDVALVEARSTTEKSVEAARISAQQALEQQRQTTNLAIQAALTASDKSIELLETATNSRAQSIENMTDAKFVTHRTMLDSQSEKVALALDAANKTRDQAFAASKEAITKAEIFNEKRFDLMTKDIDELKSYRDSTTGKGVGGAAVWGYVVAGIFLLIAIVSFVVGFGGN